MDSIATGRPLHADPGEVRSTLARRCALFTPSGVCLMDRRCLPLLGCAAVALGLLGAVVRAQPAPAAIKAAINKLAADLAAGKKVSAADGKAFAQKFNDLEDVMKAAFKVPGKSGTLEA